MRSYLVALVAVLAGVTSAAATPRDDGITFYSDDIVMAEEDMDQFFEEGSDLPEPEDVYGPFGPDDDRWDDIDEFLAENNSTSLAARDTDHFRMFRRETTQTSCDNEGNCNTRQTGDDVSLHTNCNEGGCNANHFVDYDKEKHLCDKTFTVCGAKYEMKYSGASPSCARMKYIAKANHGERYGKLMSGGSTKAICYFDRSKDYTTSCGTGRKLSLKSLVKCVWT